MKPHPSFESLTSAFLDGSISPEKLTELEDLLLQDPEARKAFRQIANLDSALHDWAPICAAQAAWADAAPLSPQSRRTSRWQTWSAAAALVSAGILTGFISGSMVSGRSLTARETKSIELPLKNPNFDGPESPSLDGCPNTFGVWGGDFCVVTGAENDIHPPDGHGMLRFLRADNRTTPPNVGSVSAEQWQVIDLRPLRNAFGGHPAKIEFSAEFNSIPMTEGPHYSFGISFYSFNGEAKDAEYLWSHRRELCLSGTEKEELNDNDPASWQKISAQIVTPPDADLVLVQVRVCPKPMPKGLKSAVEFPGQYVANSSLRLIQD
ncbi:MAG: hypothetical protein WCO60_19965 [Verrucomicrobiota bacterium]